LLALCLVIKNLSFLPMVNLRYDALRDEKEYRAELSEVEQDEKELKAEEEKKKTATEPRF